MKLENCENHTNANLHIFSFYANLILIIVVDKSVTIFIYIPPIHWVIRNYNIVRYIIGYYSIKIMEHDITSNTPIGHSIKYILLYNITYSMNRITFN